MGKFWDFVLSDTWEEYQRIQLFKKLGNKIEDIPNEKLKKIKKLLDEKEKNER